MKRLILFCFIITSFSTVYSQNSLDIENRSGKLFFKIGSDYRITPFYKNGVDRQDIIFTNVDKQSSGAAFFYGIEFFVFKNVSINFSNSFHYTVFNFERFNNIPGDDGASQANHALFLDFNFYVNYYIRIYNNNEIYLRLGRSLLNRNSNYSDKESFFDGEEYIGAIIGQSDLNLQAYNFGLGYKKNKVEIMLGIYSTSETPYFTESTALIIPYVNLAYTIGKM